MSGAARIALAALSGVLFAISFPPVAFGPASFVAFVPLFIALDRATAAQTIAAGWLFGTIGCTACVSTSIYEASSRYFDLSWMTRLTFALLVPQISAVIYIVLFAVVARRLLGTRPGLAAAVGLPAAWAGAEYLRSVSDLGIPWLLVAHAQHGFPVLLQIADLTGAYGVSFVVVGFNTLLFLLVRRPKSRAPVVVLVGLQLFVLAYGAERLSHWRAVPSQQMRVALVQGAIPLEWRRSVVRIGDSLQRLTDLTLPVLGDGPTLVVWPENAIGFAVAANRPLLDDMARAMPAGSYLLIGAPYAATRDGDTVFYNSAFLLEDSGKLTQRYDKQRLTPFAEYTPWPAPLLAAGHRGADRYVPGDRDEPLQVGRHRVGAMICYESIYAGLARALVLSGASLLVNISNDDWFGDRPALAQHLNATSLRAVENRRSLVRVTNSGISAVVQPTGEISHRLPSEQPVAEVVSVGLFDGETPYTRWGDVFAWSCLLTVIALAIARGRKVDADETSDLSHFP